MSNRTNAYIKGLSSTASEKVLSRIIGLFVTPIIIAYLGNDLYGIWIVISSFIGYMGLMDFGITGSVTQLVAKNDTKELKEKINSIVSNSFFLQVFIGIFIIILGIVCSFYFPEWFTVADESKELTWLAFLLASIGFAITLPSKTLKGMIVGKQYISLSIWLDFFLFLLITILNLTLLELKFSLLSLPISTITVRLLSYFLWFYMAKKNFPDFKISYKYFSIFESKQIFKVSSLWFVGAVSAAIIYSSDTLIIGAFLSTSMVPMYALSFRLTEVFREIIYTISSTAMPGIGQLVGEGNFIRIKDILINMFPLIFSLTLSSIIFLVYFNELFVTLWVGSEFYGGNNLSIIFAITLFTTVIFQVFSVILSSGLNLKVIAISRFAEALLNIIFSIYLIKIYGILGVALGTLFSNLITSFLIIPYFSLKFLNLTIFGFMKELKKSIFFSLFSFIVLLFFIKYLFIINLSIYVILFTNIFFSLIFIWLFGLPKGIKNKIKMKVMKK